MLKIITGAIYHLARHRLVKCPAEIAGILLLVESQPEIS